MKTNTKRKFLTSLPFLQRTGEGDDYRTTSLPPPQTNTSESLLNEGGSYLSPEPNNVTSHKTSPPQICAPDTRSVHIFAPPPVQPDDNPPPHSLSSSSEQAIPRSIWLQRLATFFRAIQAPLLSLSLHPKHKLTLIACYIALDFLAMISESAVVKTILRKIIILMELVTKKLRRTFKSIWIFLKTLVFRKK